MHELRMLAVSVATYSAAFLFLLVMGLFYFIVLYYFDTGMGVDAPATQFFQIFWIPVFFMVPLLTMKSLAEERRHGTLETMLTTPASTLEIVLAKYFAAYIFYASLWALTLLFPLIASLYLPVMQSDSRLTEMAPLLGGYLFVACSGMLYVALGIFASSLTRNTLVAGMLTFCMLLVLITSGNLLPHFLTLDDMPKLAWLRPGLEYMQTFRHLEDFSRGIVDTRPFFLYASNTLLVLGITTLVVEARATN
jgi:ABC-2 type transport system permease protein